MPVKDGTFRQHLLDEEIAQEIEYPSLPPEHDGGTGGVDSSRTA
jgi:hypothetical protein